MRRRTKKTTAMNHWQNSMQNKEPATGGSGALDGRVAVVTQRAVPIAGWRR